MKFSYYPADSELEQNIEKFGYILCPDALYNYIDTNCDIHKIEKLYNWLINTDIRVLGTSRSLYFMDNNSLVTHIYKTAFNQPNNNQQYWVTDVNADDLYEDNFQMYRYPFYNKTNTNSEIYLDEEHPQQEKRDQVKWAADSQVDFRTNQIVPNNEFYPTMAFAIFIGVYFV